MRAGDKSRQVVSFVTLLVTLFLIPASGLAGEPITPSPYVVIPRVNRPVTLSELLKGPRRSLATLSQFTQHDPHEGEPASQSTTAYLAYDRKNFYVGFVCKDRQPEQIRAHVDPRDSIGGDDRVGIVIDTYNDHRHAYRFAANPMGVQLDALMNEAGNENRNFDTLWFSRGRLTPWGYVVLMTIPFRSLRFSPAKEQTWGILLSRSIPREDEYSTWPALSREVDGFLIQEGELRGIEGISPGRNMQIIPYGFFSSRKYLDTENGQFVRQPFEDRIGLDGKWVLGSNLTLDATVNPDFSQVESDDPQITVNQRFEVYFPEKRPFFLENSNYFQTPITVLFTRRIADPQFGLRLTGKVGRTTIGALAADDRSPGEIAAPGDPSFGHRSFFNVLRINHDVGRESSLGFIWSDREFLNSFNRVVGPDGRWKISKSTGLNFQFLESSSRDLDGHSTRGTAVHLSLDHSTLHWNTYWGLDDRSPDFAADSGYVPRVDMRSSEGSAGYTFRPESNWLVAWQPYVSGSFLMDHHNVRQDYSTSPGLWMQFAHGSRLFSWYTYHRERYNGIDFLKRNYHVGIDTAASRWFNLGMAYGEGQQINLSPATGLEPFMGMGNNVSFHLTVRPSQRLAVANTFLQSRLLTVDQMRNIFNNNIFRSKWNYQFSRRLSLRLIGQYANVLPSSELSSLDYSKQLSGDILLTYLVHPGTALYVGYNNLLENYNRNLLEQFGILERSPANLLSTSAGLFVKFSYLYQF